MIALHPYIIILQEDPLSDILYIQIMTVIKNVCQWVKSKYSTPRQDLKRFNVLTWTKGKDKYT